MKNKRNSAKKREEKPEGKNRTKLRRSEIKRWWRKRRVGKTQPPPMDERSAQEMEEMYRRAEDALKTAQQRIVSDINERSAQSAPAQEERAASRPIKGVDKWQRDDNAFNEFSRAVHTRASGAVRDMRSSMSTRISMNYARVLMQTLVIAMTIMSLIIAVAVRPRFKSLTRSAAQQVTQIAQSVDGGLSSLASGEAVDKYQNQDVQIQSTDDQTYADEQKTREEVKLIDISLSTQDEAYALVRGMDGHVYYDDAPFDMSSGRSLRFSGGEFYYVRSTLVNVNGYTYQLCVGVALTYWLWLTLWIMLGLAAIDLLRSAYFVARAHTLNAEFMRPIENISETARRLNAMNMSERIDVEGIHFELRELALVVNDMLDRIETAYDGQKQFVSDASHELRTPIAVIQGYANMLERWGKDDVAVRDEAIAAINKEAANMKELVEKLLFLARHDKQTLKMKSEEVDLRALCEDAVRETRMIDTAHDIIQGDMQDVSVLGDSASLKQALRIFIDNAIKYTPAGGKVTVSCICGGLGALVSVADTGRGIPAQDLKRIFDRFYRVDDSRGAVHGHGLGLSIARIIATGHGGRINVRSREGVGSTFTMELPGVVRTGDGRAVSR